jgi:hypothetical protein
MMMNTQQLLKLVLLVSPIFLIQLGLAIYALVDLKGRTRLHGPRWAWALGLIVSALSVPTGIIVSGVYLAWARHIEG